MVQAMTAGHGKQLHEPSKFLALGEAAHFAQHVVFSLDKSYHKARDLLKCQLYLPILVETDDGNIPTSH